MRAFKDVIVIERLPVSADMHKRLLAVARDYRKLPTSSEKRLWKVLQGRQIAGDKFRREHPIGPFVVDFFCPDSKLIVEADGPIHASQVERDHERQSLLEVCGYRMVRFTADDVEQDLETVLARVRASLTPQPSQGTAE